MEYILVNNMRGTMMTSKKIKKIKKWPREKKLELKWVRVSEHWDNLRGENPSLDSIFSIFIQPCRHQIVIEIK